MSRRNNLTVALSAGWNTYPNRLKWIIEHGFALEYAPNPENLDILPTHLGEFISEGIPVRYHGLFPGYEIGHADIAIAERAVSKHTEALKAIQGWGEPVITFHIGLNPNDPLDLGRATDNLSRLVEYARSLGITICLENLRRGLTSNPDNLIALARESGAMITLDTGHALSSEGIRSGKSTGIDFLNAVADQLFEVHIYEEETDRHLPPRDMTVLGPIVDRLLATQCTWWTIELDDYDEVLATRNLLLNYLRSKSLAD